MRHNRYSHILIVLVILFTASIGASGRTKNYTVEDGMADLYVECIVQDSAGFIWVGTKSGISRIEADKFTSGRIETHSASGTSLRPITRRIYGMLLDHNQQLWVATDGDGLLRYNYNKNIFSPVYVPDSSDYSVVRRVIEDNTGTIWISTPYSVGRVAQDGSVAWYHLSANKTKCYINSIFYSQDGTLWAGSRENGLYLFSAAHNAFEPFLYSVDGKPFSRNIISIGEIHDKLLIGTDANGLHVLDKTKRSAKEFNHKQFGGALRTEEIYTIYTNSQGQALLSAINGGTAVFDIDNETFRKLYYLENDDELTASSFLEDKKGNLWIGTHSKGLFVTGQDNPAISQTTLREPHAGLPTGKPVSSLLSDTKGNVWAGTDGAGLYVRRAGSSQYVQAGLNTGLVSKVILDIDEMPDGTLWLSTWGDGIVIYDPVRERVRYESTSKPHSVSYNNIKSCNFDGRFCWITTHGDGVNLYDWAHQSFVGGSAIGISDADLKLPLWGNNSTKDKKSRVWFATTIGLFMFDGTQMHSFYFDTEDSTSIPSNNVPQVFSGDDGTVWIATLGGLCRYNEQANSFTRSHLSIFHQPVYAISGLKNGSILVTTPSAFIRYDMLGDTAIVYTSLDYISIRNFVERAIATDKSGTLYLGGIGSLLSVNPDNLIKNKKIAVLPVALFLDNEFIDPGVENRYLHKQLFLTDTVQIDYSKSLLRIDYLTLDPMSGPHLSFRYMLEGFDNDWHLAGTQTSAQYSNLPYGDYYFVVQVHDNEGLVVGESKRILLQILPPWWATLWFKILAYLFAVLALFGLFWLRIHILTKQKKRIEQEVALRTSDLMTAYERLSHDQQMLLDQNDNLLETNEMTVVRMRALRESLRTKDNLIAIIAHDLKNPIGAASGMLSLLGGFFEKGNKEKFDKFQLHLHNSMSSMQSLVDSMSDWQLSEGGQLQFSPKDLDLDHTAREALSLVSASAERKNIALDYRCELKKYAFADPRMVATICRNLIQNAIKFTPKQGSISLTLREENGSAVCSIADTGTGMTETVRQSLLSGDSIISRVGTDNEKGIGLGMQTCRKFIKACSGELRINTELGKGSEFSFTLPLSDNSIESLHGDLTEEAHYPEESLDEETLLEQHCVPRIVVVDDNVEILEYLSESFQDGYEVLVFQNPELALEYARIMVPDIIVSDVLMPQMSGTEFCRRIKADSITRHIPLVFLTSQSSAVSAIEGLSAGADDYMTKPFDVRILKAKIQSIVLNRRRLRESIERGDSTVQEEPVDPFLIEFHKIVESNIDNYNLSVEFIADKMDYCKSQIYRKCVAITGVAPAEYIRERKLALATRLLANKDKSISDVAFDLGFSDPQYFSKVFTKKFGVSPKKFRDRL